jgi:acyl-coenzyme A thioesterase PaaI-like protein
VSGAERDRGAGRLLGVFDDASELVSYGYLGCSSAVVDPAHAVGHMRIRRDMRTGSGALLAAPLAIAMLDTAGISIDGTYHAACTHVDVHLWDPGRPTGVVRVDGAVVREARSALFTEARFVDPERPERALGLGTVDWAVVGPTPPGFTYRDPGPGVDDAPNLPPLVEAYDAVRTAGGFAIEGLSVRVGTEVLHHGPVLVASEAAALDVAEALGPAVLEVETFSVRFVRAGRLPPFAITASAVSSTPAGMVCRTEVRQDDGTLVAVGLLRLRTGPPP